MLFNLLSCLECPARQANINLPAALLYHPADRISTDELEIKRVSVSSGTADLIIPSVMRGSLIVWPPGLSLLVVLGYLTSVAITFSEYSYWYGRPQPIGIDFAADAAFAVYADSAKNFTILGAVQPNRDNPYYEYIYTLYLHRGDLNPSIIIDDSDHSISLTRFQRSGNWILRQHIYLCDLFCDEDDPFTSTQWWYHAFCKWRRWKPWSTANHRKLLSKWRMRRLLAFIPRWIRDPYDGTLTRSNIVLSVLDILEELKRVTLRDHNIRIKSAIISRPSWVYHNMNFIFEEACFLADIKCFGAARDRTEIVTKTAPARSNVLVIEHGQYNLDFRYATWNDFNKYHVVQNSVGVDGGSQRISVNTAWIVGHGYSHNVTHDHYLPTHAENEHPMQQIRNAICKLKYGRDSFTEHKLEDMTVGVTFRQRGSKKITVKNMTAEHVVYVEDWFVGLASNALQILLSRSLEINNYLETQGNFDRARDSKEYQAAFLDVIANVPPPAEIGSWVQPVDHVIILGDEGYTDLLLTAVKKAIGWNDTVVDGMCIHTPTFAARGAALEGRKKRRSHDDSRKPRKWDEDERDWVAVEKVINGDEL